MTSDERIAVLEARVVALQAIVGTLLRAVEERLDVEVVLGDEPPEDDPLCS